VLKAILCPVDFSEHSERALRYALGLAAMAGARITVLSVTDPLLDAAARAAGSRETSAAQVERALGALFDRIAGESTRPPAAAVVARVGQPAEEILRLANQIPADIIVMGTQGMGAAERFLLGSTTEKVLRASHVPVLAVPPARR
jgi:nucleotide-binding universal stress UspA family protein